MKIITKKGTRNFITLGTDLEIPSKGQNVQERDLKEQVGNIRGVVIVENS